jgi:class 3 adenylate cyclase/tetratricopeptide (TPR) repeat protein
VICPTCEAENRDGARFCNECGSPLEARCPSCGAEHRPDQKFCDACGAALPALRATRPPEVAPTPAELRMVSVLFVDLVGYTSLSESRDAEDVRDLLGRYFDTARTIVERYGGSIEKFIGDAVMAVWGAPVAREDDAERAVRAALEMVDAVAAFGDEVGAPTLQARAGVVTGQVASAPKPGEALVVGDSVNTASRVQSSAQPGTVYVDDTTRQVTSAAIAYEDAGEHAVKGKAEPLHLWNATRVVAGIGGDQRQEGLEAPFTGRDSELRLVKELFHSGADRRGARLVGVSGAAGVGKSRLRWEFENYLDGLAETVLWHSGRCVSYGEGVAYWALAEMVRQRLGIAEEAAADDVAAKLAAGLERWVVDTAEREFLAPRLGALLGVAEPKLGREELFAGWRLFFERLADHDPVVMVFEDMQWADEGLLDFVEHLLDWSAQHPIFILTFARPELSQRREGWPAGRRGATLLYLEPLDEVAMGELLDALVEGLPAEARQRVVAQAEGIPLYALETVRALVDRGVLEHGDGRLTLAGELDALDVPASLSSLLAARLDALEPDERALVKAMAVFGGSFPRSAAAAISPVPDERLDAVLTSLVRKQVLAVRADRLSPDRGQYGFAQTLLRTVAYEMLARRERKPLHIAAAEHLREAFSDDGEDVAEVIAAHYLDAYRAGMEDPDAGELRAAALAALRRAGQRATTVGAPEAAERAYRTAIELADDEVERIDLMTAAGDMAGLAGHSEAAVELFAAAAGAHEASGRKREAARLARQLGQELGAMGRRAEAIERIEAALEVLGPASRDADVAALSIELGTAWTFTGQHERAEAALERGLRLAQALELTDVFCNGLGVKAVLCSVTGRVEEARILYAGAIELAERHGLNLYLLRAQLNSGDLLMRFDLPGAVERSREALASARRFGDRVRESVAASNLMIMERLAGRWGEAERLAAELLTGVDGPRAWGEALHLELGLLCATRGDVEAARGHLAEIGSWERNDDAELRGSHAALTGAVALTEGRAADALAILADLVRDMIATGGHSGDSTRQAFPDAIDAAVELGRFDTLADLVALLADEPPGYVAPFMRAQLARAKALLAAGTGEHQSVEGEITAAIERFQALGYPYWLARAQTDLAAWLLGQDRAPEAAPLLDDAIATLERLGAAPALAGARELRLSSPAPAGSPLART